MTELREADEDPGGGGPALPLAPEHDVVLGARGGEQEVREQGVATGVIQRGQEEPGVITTQRKRPLKEFSLSCLENYVN